MKVKTSELQGAALDWAVAKCEGREPSYYKGRMRATAHPDFPDSPPMFGPELKYSTDWAQGGPIIEREKIELVRGNDLYFPQGNETGDFYEPLWIAGKMHGQTPLIAAMRCYVASKLGDEVDVPDELMEGEVK